MRVDSRVIPQAASGVSAGRRSEEGPGFSLGQGAGSPAGAPSGAAGPTSLAGLDAVLVLQNQTDTPQERRRRAARRGHDLLDGLDRLKAALLVGRVPVQDLRAIAGRLAERDPSGDPRLDGLIAEIELRAAVELAKLDARAVA